MMLGYTLNIDCSILTSERKSPARIAPAGLSYLFVSATYGRLFTQVSTSFFTWSFAVP